MLVSHTHTHTDADTHTQIQTHTTNGNSLFITLISTTNSAVFCSILETDRQLLLQLSQYQLLKAKTSAEWTQHYHHEVAATLISTDGT